MSILDRLDVEAVVKARHLDHVAGRMVFGAMCGFTACDAFIPVPARHVDNITIDGIPVQVWGFASECRDKNAAGVGNLVRPACVPGPGIPRVIHVQLDDYLYCPASHCVGFDLINDGESELWEADLDLGCGSTHITLEFIEKVILGDTFCVPKVTVSGCNGHDDSVTEGNEDTVECWWPFTANLEPVEMGFCCRCGEGISEDVGRTFFRLTGQVPPVKMARHLGYVKKIPLYGFQDCCPKEECKIISPCCPEGIPDTLRAVLRTVPGSALDGCDCLDGYEVDLHYIGNIDDVATLRPVWKSDLVSCVTSYGCTVKFTFFLICGGFTENVLFDQKREYLPAGAGGNPACPGEFDVCSGDFFSLLGYFEKVEVGSCDPPGDVGCGVIFQNSGWYCWGCANAESCDPLYMDFNTEDFSASTCDGAICNVGVEVMNSA